MNVLLSGIVGSTAYGLAHAESDIDRLGIYAEDTTKMLGLATPKESIVKTDPDSTHHEARKALKLLLACNPTVTEILWLDGYEQMTSLGQELVGLRGKLLSANKVRSAYLGYAQSQFQRLANRGDGSFSADTRKRTEKHARHLIRLTRQGMQLHRSGHLSIRLDDPEGVRRLGQEIAARPEAAEGILAQAEEVMSRTPSALPESPDLQAAEDWLLRVRKHYYDK